MQRSVEYLKSVESLLTAAGPAGKRFVCFVCFLCSSFLCFSESLRHAFDELASRLVKEHSDPPLRELKNSFAAVFPNAVSSAVAAQEPLCVLYCSSWQHGGWRKDMNKVSVPLYSRDLFFFKKNA
jgi:hypothetical protein